MDVMSAIPTAKNCEYTSCYCEENVWKLCELVKESCTREDLSKCYAAFISNEKRQIPLWHQRARKAEDLPVVWDYHVIFVNQSQNGSQIFDLDTLLPFPCSFQNYIEACIGDNIRLKKDYWRMFRLIPATEFLTRFASDRTHMLKEDGSWLAPPPKYPPICTEESTNNLQQFISMDPSQGFGKVLSLQEFIDHFDSSK